MNQKRYLWFVVTVAAGVFLFSSFALCGDIKARMKDRLPRIIELKAAGIIGENNQGFLAFIGGNKSEQALVDAENQDRQLVYGAIAKQQGTTPDVVGRRRALQIADNAKPGEWLQNSGGKWVRK
ncbi:YdbL family protein [uncultured Desulfosarcina sp.]|uniref:YdbL family protein n=1 Tax=uncultured Desulfosarcina sp. TaxID=218289 RepID=UPI0029C9AFD3|nr:YdbL family protein [uncultured Desulfosarcina sp.]